MQHRSIYELFEEVSAANSDRVAFQYNRGGRWNVLTWAEARKITRRVAKALIAAGVKKGERVSILSRSRLEWCLCDYAIVCRGCVTVGIYESSLAPDCSYIIDHSDSVLLFVENQAQLEKILAVRADLPRLKQIVLIEGPGRTEQGILGWDEFLAPGDGVDEGELFRCGKAIRPDDLASLVYTSGTTGVPKGVMLSHRNLLATTTSACDCIAMRARYTMLLFLPLAHVFARLLVYCCLNRAVTVAFSEEITRVPQDLTEVRPHFLPGVPRFYEKVQETIIGKVEAAGVVKRRLFDWAVEVGRRLRSRVRDGQAVPMLLRFQHAVADRLVLRKVREAFGGRWVFGISGSAPLNPSVGEFFDACGVLVLEGIGMTENTSFSNVNRIDHNKFGTVGPVGPGIEMKLADDGEVLYRGDNVMQGYFKDPEATARAIDPDGWLHTGDIGVIDEDGFLAITDRKKELIITAGGKNVAPARVEGILRTSSYISQAVAYGDRRKYLTALLTLSEENIRAWAAKNGLDGLSVAQLAGHAKVNRLVAREVDRLNRLLASFETIKKFYIVPRDFSIRTGELTSTMKLRRDVVIERYKAELAALY